MNPTGLHCIQDKAKPCMEGLIIFEMKIGYLNVLLLFCVFISIDSDTNTDYYSVLNIKRSATENEMKRAYRILLLNLHPDKNKVKIMRTFVEDVQKCSSFHLEIFTQCCRLVYNVCNVIKLKFCEYIAI